MSYNCKCSSSSIALVSLYISTFELFLWLPVYACLRFISLRFGSTLSLTLLHVPIGGGRNGKKVKVPREELHTCHKKASKKRPELTREPSAIDVGVGVGRFDLTMSDLPELEDYYNNVDENNRLLRSKER